MKTITVSPQAQPVHELLRQARGNGVILELPEGERFILTPIELGLVSMLATVMISTGRPRTL